MNKYITIKRFKQAAIAGSVNIPAQTECFETNNMIIVDNKPICFATSENGHTYFAINKQKVVELFSTVPFLNGGLFECLDKDITNSKGKTSVMYYDGFSRIKNQRAFLPNCLFFDKEKGIIPLLNRYNF